MYPHNTGSLSAPPTFQHMLAHRNPAPQRHTVGFDSASRQMPRYPSTVAPIYRAAETAEPATAEAAKDIFRETALRYAGFANEVTEAGKASGNAFFKKINPLGWAISLGYGTSDAIDKTLNTHAEVLKKTGDHKEAKLRALAKTGEVTLFHSMASWFGPVFLIIKPTHKLADKILHGMQRKAEPWATLAALASIAVAPKILDPIAEFLLHHIYQPITNALIERHLNKSRR